MVQTPIIPKSSMDSWHLDIQLQLSRLNIMYHVELLAVYDNENLIQNMAL